MGLLLNSDLASKTIQPSKNEQKRPPGCKFPGDGRAELSLATVRYRATSHSCEGGGTSGWLWLRRIGPGRVEEENLSRFHEV